MVPQVMIQIPEKAEVFEGTQSTHIRMIDFQNI